MKKQFLIILLLSFGFIGNSNATVLICKDDNDLSTCSFPPPQKLEYLECKEGFVLSGNRCYKEGEEIPQEEIRPIEYHENGNKKSEALYKTNDGSLLRLTMFYENGQKEMEYRYNYGTLLGVTMFYEDGQKEMELSYNRDSKKHGKYTEWDEDGQITSEAIYKDDVCISGDC